MVAKSNERMISTKGYIENNAGCFKYLRGLTLTIAGVVIGVVKLEGSDRISEGGVGYKTPAHWALESDFCCCCLRN